MQNTFALVCLYLALVVPVQVNALDDTAGSAIRALLSNQQDAWNRGDIDGFMEGYWHSDSLRFASGGDVQHGWQQTRDRYHNSYPDLEAMGKLTFTIHSLEILSADYAFVFGRYDLERKTDHPTGLFTLLFRQFEDGWRIVFDHTSADTSEDGE